MQKLFAGVLSTLLLICPAHAKDDNALIAAYITTVNPRLSEHEAIQIIDTVFRVSRNLHLDPMLMFGVIQTESTFRPHVSSSYGAQGLMQVVPRWHPEKLRGRNLFAIEDAIEVGGQVLRDCMVRAKFDLTRAMSCYSGYPVNSVQRYQARVWHYRNSILKELQ